jgi:hypothetical protein
MKRPTLQIRQEIGRGNAIVHLHADCSAGTAA